jgi:hypothetical protein
MNKLTEYEGLKTPEMTRKSFVFPVENQDEDERLNKLIEFFSNKSFVETPVERNNELILV